MWVVRHEEPEDFDGVFAVHEQAFGQQQEAKLVDRLRSNCPELLSLVATTAEGLVVGHILFSSAKIVGGSEVVKGMGLAPLAVLPAFQRQGVGSLLVRRGLSEIGARGSSFVLVLGHPEYYARFGFRKAADVGVRCPWEVPAEAFMIYLFDTYAVPAGVGYYREEFHEVI